MKFSVSHDQPTADNLIRCVSQSVSFEVLFLFPLDWCAWNLLQSFATQMKPNRGAHSRWDYFARRLRSCVWVRACEHVFAINWVCIKSTYYIHVWAVRHHTVRHRSVHMYDARKQASKHARSHTYVVFRRLVLWSLNTWRWASEKCSSLFINQRRPILSVRFAWLCSYARNMWIVNTEQWSANTNMKESWFYLHFFSISFHSNRSHCPIWKNERTCGSAEILANIISCRILSQSRYRSSWLKGKNVIHSFYITIFSRLGSLSYVTQSQRERCHFHFIV